jgi:tetratricopeptide (TPR) repeat protein
MHGRPGEAGPYVTLAAEAPFANDRDVPLGQGLLTLVGGLVLLGKSDIAERILDRAGAVRDPDPVFGAFLDASRCALSSVAPISGRWQLQRAFHEGRRSVETLGALGATHGQSIALYYFGIAAMHLGRYQEARDACLRSAELTRRGGSGVSEGWPLLFLARAYLRLGQLEAAQKAVQPLLALPDWTVRQMLPVVLAEARFREGRFRDAEEEALPACTGLSPRLARLAAAVLTRAQLAQGRPADALSSTDRALRLPTSNGLESEIDLLTIRAEALHACGKQHEAVDAIARARAAIFAIADDIDDLSLKRSFLENVEPCARALRLAQSWAAPS